MPTFAYKGFHDVFARRFSATFCRAVFALTLVLWHTAAGRRCWMLCREARKRPRLSAEWRAGRWTAFYDFLSFSYEFLLLWRTVENLL